MQGLAQAVQPPGKRSGEVNRMVTPNVMGLAQPTPAPEICNIPPGCFSGALRTRVERTPRAGV